ncbi:hypothetical protein CHX27_04675 [Flavobacterium aurantiibacter]|uniref:Uncharacterized protein n=1 Tax=Flavobacterium aurantiibacter TaxID=2023067 RepID=A0A255ZZM8_9FLAO|nr:hypothetical protein CHX27_04675 [Flavobacterium aurantiibacter]
MAVKNVFFLFAFFIATTLFGQNALLKNELLAAYDFETTEAYAEAKKADDFSWKHSHLFCVN